MLFLTGEFILLLKEVSFLFFLSEKNCILECEITFASGSIKGGFTLFKWKINIKIVIKQF